MSHVTSQQPYKCINWKQWNSHVGGHVPNYIVILWEFGLFSFCWLTAAAAHDQVNKNVPYIIEFTTYQKIFCFCYSKFGFQLLRCSWTESVKHMVISLSFTLLADPRLLQQIVWNEPANNSDLLIIRKEEDFEKEMFLCSTSTMMISSDVPEFKGP